MKKETQKIATNTSSGAKKVENIEKTIKNKESDGKAVKNIRAKATKTITVEKAAKGDAALGDSRTKQDSVKKQNAQSTNGKAEAESAAAKARVEAALKRKELKEKRKAERLAKSKAKKEARRQWIAEKKAEIEKKKQAKKALIAKRAAAKKELAQKRAAEKKAKAEARYEKKKQAQASSHKRKNEGKKRERRENQGYGGWIAAVVALGVTTLALATTSTVSMVENNRAMDAMISSYRGTMYEMTGILENVEKDLDRVRVSDSSSQQSRILTDLLVQARLAEADIEKLPIAAEADRNISAFVNHTANVCEGILTKLRNGEPLSQKDREVLEGLYQINHSLKTEMAKIVENMSDEDFMDYVKKGKGALADSLGEMEKMTLTENSLTFKKEPPMSEMNPPQPKTMEEPSKIEAVKAEELCAQYFKGYNVAEYQCVGETVTKDYAAYNVQGYDDKGSLLFAEIDQMNGKLIRFDYYEECAGETFDLKNSERIAEEFLEALGYEDMEIVRCRQNGSTTDFTFVYEDDEVAYYPDEIRVKVCRTRGVVSGMDASKYLKNHRGRGELNVKINLAQAQEKLYGGLSVEASRLSVIKTARGEKAAYEMLCSYGEERYLIYLDAMTGEEISILNVNTIQ